MNTMRYLIGIIGMIYTITIMGMEPEIMKIAKKTANKEYSFVDLISNNATLVRKFVAKEQRGKFCPALHRAEEILDKHLLVPQDKVPYALLTLHCSEKTKSFVNLIASKSRYCRVLI